MIEEIDNRKLPVAELKITDGEDPQTFFENYFGMRPTSAAEMPADNDVEATVFIKLI